MKLTVAVVNHGNYLGRGEQYVETMRAMVARNLTLPYEFVCLTDEGEHTGWWAKIELFRRGRFKGRVLYLDLDSVVTGSLDELATKKGIIGLADWSPAQRGLCSSVMCWNAGEHEEVFKGFKPEIKERFRGDQDWMRWVGGWRVLPRGLCYSYRYHCQAKPLGAHVSFHGEPKPHVVDGWVPQFWRT